MIKLKSIRNAFSMLELIFVIVILGIISSLGAEIIANVYESYILQRAQHRASLKTELAATQIANRLRYAIPGTVYRIRKDNNATETIESALTTDGKNYNGLLWVAYDGDSFESMSGSASTGKARRPGWSGFCDIDNSSKNLINTPGSNLGLANTIIENLSKNTSGTITKHLSDAVLYFPHDLTAHTIASGTSTASYENNITLDDANRTIVEHYKLAWTSYALVVDEEGDLYLYYNFSPIPQTHYGNGSKSLLLKNISTFKFKGAGRSIRFKICKQENIGEDFNITSCKEKVVF